MQKFTFKENKTLLIPNTNTFRPIKDKNGAPIMGDALIRKFGKIVTEFEKKGRPVPIPEQSFVAWVKQAVRLLDGGMSSEEIFARTIV